MVRAALTAGPRPERVPLSFGQRRLWFLNQFDDASAVYNMPVVMRITGELDAAALRSAVGDVIARHESLRTVFPDVDGVPYQCVLPADTEVELTTRTVRAADVTDVVGEFAGSGFDLATELPLRAALFTVHPDDTDGAGVWVLVLVVHHIAGDGASASPFLRDLSAAYAARRVGAVPGWSPLEVQYADYTLWQRQVLGADSIRVVNCRGRCSTGGRHWPSRRLSWCCRPIEPGRR